MPRIMWDGLLTIDLLYSAVHGGADRIELCGSLGVGGGTTPSLGLLKCVRRAVNGVPIMVSTATQRTITRRGRREYQAITSPLR